MAALSQLVKYPQSAKSEGIEGRVLVAVSIDTAGHSHDCEIRQGVRQDLNQAAIDAVSHLAWTPARKDGRAVECTVVVPIQFKLDKDKKSGK
jgi:periplasmic protein TonB